MAKGAPHVSIRDGAVGGEATVERAAARLKEAKEAPCRHGPFWCVDGLGRRRISVSVQPPSDRPWTGLARRSQAPRRLESPFNG